MEPVCLQVLNSGSAEVQVAPTEQEVPFAHMAPAVVVVTPPVEGCRSQPLASARVGKLGEHGAAQVFRDKNVKSKTLLTCATSTGCQAGIVVVTCECLDVKVCHCRCDLEEFDSRDAVLDDVVLS